MQVGSIHPCSLTCHLYRCQRLFDWSDILRAGVVPDQRVDSSKVAIDNETKLERQASKNVLGRNIARARELSSKTQQEVAATLTLEQGEISAVEKGKRGLSFIGYQRLAEAIGCGLDDFRVSKSQLQAEMSRLVAKSPRNHPMASSAQ